MNRLAILTVGLTLTLLLGCNAADSAATGDAEAAAGQKLIKDRKFAEAIPHLEQAVQQPLDAYSKSDVLSMIGNCYNEMEQMDESLRYHDLAIAEDPQNHKTYVNKGIVYRLLGDYDKAEQMYTKALEIAPDYAELNASMGALSIFKQDFAAAIKHLERSIELDKTMPVAHSNLAFAYASVGRFDEADAELKQAGILGYHQPEVIQERIDNLRKLSAGK